MRDTEGTAALARGGPRGAAEGRGRRPGAAGGLAAGLQLGHGGSALRADGLRRGHMVYAGNSHFLNSALKKLASAILEQAWLQGWAQAAAGLGPEAGPPQLNGKTRPQWIPVQQHDLPKHCPVLTAVTGG